ncbi:MAG: type II secretion system protein [bacterium]|nr:type II secretion system protein [bacterium]
MKETKKVKNNKGFTLIEILVVIGIIAILAGIVLVAINPSRQFAQANNTQRTSNVTTILNAIGQYIADNKGTVPAGIDSTVKTLKKADLDICALLMPTYVSSLPVDPKNGAAVTDCSTYDTGYTIQQDATTKRITVNAPSTEKPPAAADISVTR